MLLTVNIGESCVIFEPVISVNFLIAIKTKPFLGMCDYALLYYKTRI